MPRFSRRQVARGMLSVARVELCSVLARRVVSAPRIVGYPEHAILPPRAAGNSKPRKPRCAKLAIALGVTAAMLLAGSCAWKADATTLSSGTVNLPSATKNYSPVEKGYRSASATLAGTASAVRCAAGARLASLPGRRRDRLLTPPDEAAAERWPQSFSAVDRRPMALKRSVVKGLSARRISIPSEVSDSFASWRSQMTAEAGDPGL
jgi:hypothetical protein